MPHPHPTIFVWSPGIALGLYINPRDLRAERMGGPGEPRHWPWATEASTTLSAIAPEPSAWTFSHVGPQIQMQESLGLQEPLPGVPGTLTSLSR